MLQGVDKLEQIRFTSVHDEEEDKTVFVLRPLSGTELMRSTNKDDSFESLMNLLKISIVSIENFSTNDVNEAIELLPSSVLTELLEQVNKLNHLTEDDQKN